jgi:hypothetical protein
MLAIQADDIHSLMIIPALGRFGVGVFGAIREELGTRI